MDATSHEGILTMAVTFQLKDGTGVVVVSGALTSAGVDAFREQFVEWWTWLAWTFSTARGWAP